MVKAENLYLPEKYKVKLGKGRSVGLCTVWSDPEILVKTVPELLDHCSIIGTLYSKEGINIILRNLCLNPEIRYLLVWGKGPLSQTPIGKTAWTVLEGMWQKGLADSGKIEGSGYYLHANMDFSVIKKMVENVEIIDVSKEDLPSVLAKVKSLESKKQTPYMEPKRFPIFKRTASGELPSEEVGWITRGEKTVDAWIKVIDRITRYGIVKTDEYGTDIKELGSVTWVIEGEDSDNLFIPDWPEDMKKTMGINGEESVKVYINNVFKSPHIPEGTAYTYGNRLKSYQGAGGETIDQMQFIIKQFNSCNTTRRAVVSLLNPNIDQGATSPPCLTQIQVLRSGDKLNMYTSFRGHDLYKAGIINAFALRSVQKELALALGLNVGKLAITSISAWISEDDWEDAEKLCRCEIWDRPVIGSLKKDNLGDVRGIVLVSVEDGMIVGEVVTANGDAIAKIEKETAHEASLELSKLDLLSQPSHYMDIARQFQKAEIARDLGIPFEQDKPLKININGKEIITGKN